MKRICRRNSNTASGEFVMLAKKGMNLFSEGLKKFKATWTDLNENLKTSEKNERKENYGLRFQFFCCFFHASPTWLLNTVSSLFLPWLVWHDDGTLWSLCFSDKTKRIRERTSLAKWDCTSLFVLFTAHWVQILFSFFSPIHAFARWKNENMNEKQNT